eukprot:TRINITY_DN5311_c0_g1_i2.p1 TRINITY_DN5311_c0_g1~~TRINITY_DN5311_c0_g1_i2.p1  ORF type:complete len:127 (+),score=5.47 TRINITY_DN5311_c0_g1_i2:147-527(+)
MNNLQDPDDFLDMYITTGNGKSGLSSINYIVYLPHDLIRNILLRCSVESIYVGLVIVNRFFCDFCNSLWKDLHQMMYEVSDKGRNCDKMPDITWKREFIVKYKLEKLLKFGRSSRCGSCSNLGSRR